MVSAQFYENCEKYLSEWQETAGQAAPFDPLRVPD